MVNERALFLFFFCLARLFLAIRQLSPRKDQREGKMRTTLMRGAFYGKRGVAGNAKKKPRKNAKRREMQQNTKVFPLTKRPPPKAEPSFYIHLYFSFLLFFTPFLLAGKGEMLFGANFFFCSLHFFVSSLFLPLLLLSPKAAPVFLSPSPSPLSPFYLRRSQQVMSFLLLLGGMLPSDSSLNPSIVFTSGLFKAMSNFY